MLESTQIMKYLFLLVLVLISSGCSLLKGKPKPAEPAVAFSTSSENPKPLQDIKILDKEKFSQGGKILVVPFSPGVNVAANDEFDRASLMIVKGIADSLNGEAGARFTVLNAENAETADLILEGRIMSMKESGKLKKVVSFKDKKVLAVEGKMVDARSGAIVFHFTETQESINKKQDFIDLSSSIGQEIGKFLNSSIK